MRQNASKFLMDSRLSTGCGTSTCMRCWLSRSERSSLCYAAVPLEMLFNSAQSPVLSQQLFWIQFIGILPFIEKQIYNFAPKLNLNSRRSHHHKVIIPVQESCKHGIHLEQLLPGRWSCLRKFFIIRTVRHFPMLSPHRRGTAHQNRSSVRWQNTHRCWSSSSCPHSPNPINCTINLVQIYLSK